MLEDDAGVALLRRSTRGVTCTPAGRALLERLPTFAAHPRIAERAREHGLSAVETAGGDAGLLAGLLDWFGTRATRASDTGPTS